jgi:ubiquinone/menaquinone biosynthesis C-methylase UbiE
LGHAITYLNRLFRKPRMGGRESSRAYSEWEYRVGADLVKTYLEPAGDLRGKRVLDIGCGLGGKTIAYGEGGASHVFGTDISLENTSSSVAYAGSKEVAHSWAFFTSDAACMPVEDAVFDTVVANDTMEHFSEPEQALSEMVRITKPGGAVWIFFTPYFSPLGSHLYDYIYIPWCHLIFTKKQLFAGIREVVAARQNERPGEDPTTRAEKIMESFERDLNRMSVRRFFNMVKVHPSMQVTFREFKPPKYSLLRGFNRLPLIRELFTGALICRLEKQG